MLFIVPSFLSLVATAPKRVVMKFGGSSVRDAERITEVCTLVKDLISEDGIAPCLVCSAMGKTTNGLLSAADKAIGEGVVDLSSVRELHEETIATLNLAGTPCADEVLTLLGQCERTLEGVALLGELSARTRDLVVSYGERMSGRVVAATLSEMGVPAAQHEAWDVGVLTSSDFGEATVLEESWGLIPAAFDKMDDGVVPVVTGFIGKDEAGRITTLGRGGSDLTASLLGAAAGYDEVQVWKDVDGILTADPRLCPDALPVSQVSFEEAAELAYFGAQVLHPLAMQPCKRVGVPFRVKNSYNRDAVGTLITAEDPPADSRAGFGLVSAITSKDNVQLIDITSNRMLGQYGFLARIFEAFNRHQLSIDVIASSEVSVSLTLNKNQVITRKEVVSPGDDVTETSPAMLGLLADLEQVAQVKVSGGHAIVTLIANVDRSASVVAVVHAEPAIDSRVKVGSGRAASGRRGVRAADRRARDARQPQAARAGRGARRRRAAAARGLPALVRRAARPRPHAHRVGRRRRGARQGRRQLGREGDCVCVLEKSKKRLDPCLDLFRLFFCLS